LFDELIPCVAAMVDDVVVGFEHAVSSRGRSQARESLKTFRRCDSDEASAARPEGNGRLSRARRARLSRGNPYKAAAARRLRLSPGGPVQR
jgi:hypothetical protein